jgi:hypothetical protein
LTTALADMFDAATTAANVLASDQNNGIFRGVLGAAIAAGDVIAKDTGNNNAAPMGGKSPVQISLHLGA